MLFEMLADIDALCEGDTDALIDGDAEAETLLDGL